MNVWTQESRFSVLLVRVLLDSRRNTSSPLTCVKSRPPGSNRLGFGRLRRPDSLATKLCLFGVSATSSLADVVFGVASVRFAEELEYSTFFGVERGSSGYRRMPCGTSTIRVRSSKKVRASATDQTQRTLEDTVFWTRWGLVKLRKVEVGRASILTNNNLRAGVWRFLISGLSSQWWLTQPGVGINTWSARVCVHDWIRNTWRLSASDGSILINQRLNIHSE